jgi:UPF0176 protein
MPPATPDAVLNAAAYCFAEIDDPHVLFSRLSQQAAGLGLRGTILLAPEGINLFLAGEPQGVRSFLASLRADPRFAALHAKESWSASQPFRRLRVKVKREIIRMDHPAIRPAVGRAPALPAATLRRWLDQGHDDAGRPVVLLDTRNAFEVDAGAFDGAVDWRITKFTEFPQAFEAHREELEGKTVVSYCTGGIRCEKAALYMRERGLDHVWQLDGGILQYFEDAGGTHFHGRCFVFDGREALDERLTPLRERAND